MAGVDVRPEPPDEEPGRSLMREYEREIAARYPGWDATQGPTATAEEISPPSGSFLVAYVGGEPVACGAVKRLDGETAEMKRVFVAPHARGRGVARHIVAALEARARELGYRRIRLDTGDRMPEAVALYRSAGYEGIPDYNGNPYAAYWFEKRLG